MAPRGPLRNLLAIQFFSALLVKQEGFLSHVTRKARKGRVRGSVCVRVEHGLLQSGNRQQRSTGKPVRAVATGGGIHAQSPLQTSVASGGSH